MAESREARESADRPSGPVPQGAPGPEAATGPVPQGAPPDGDTPEGTPSPSGASPTGHPSPPHPAEVKQSAEASLAPSDTVVAPDDQPVEEPPAEEEAEEPSRLGRSGIRAADRALLRRATKERDEYLDQLRHARADFENYRKRVLRQQTEHLERAAEILVEKLLPILDTFEAAIDHGQGYEQVHVTLMATLEKEGLERVHPLGKPFDPTEADAVAHEDGDDGPVVAEVLRPGYRWKGRVVRPAMVRVRG